MEVQAIEVVPLGRVGAVWAIHVLPEVVVPRMPEPAVKQVLTDGHAIPSTKAELVGVDCAVHSFGVAAALAGLAAAASMANARVAIGGTNQRRGCGAFRQDARSRRLKEGTACISAPSVRYSVLAKTIRNAAAMWDESQPTRPVLRRM